MTHFLRTLKDSTECFMEEQLSQSYEWSLIALLVLNTKFVLKTKLNKQLYTVIQYKWSLIALNQFFDSFSCATTNCDDINN